MADRRRGVLARVWAAIRHAAAWLSDSSVSDQVDRNHERMHPAQTQRGRTMGGTGGF
ncbi:hypothetical protein IM660_15420 [Ruania alkalisoli]|uniref:Uncharacterized protein n=1 Tax=Ruania alkalisoli TaxID=2779775 RepID=A0A7M1SR21_9MICO|nr:hypothetical protein [Ruania alkalisoli]QOR70010.1 hypothetical protein IM660_15420 [Ruania alkalisoli]